MELDADLALSTQHPALKTSPLFSSLLSPMPPLYRLKVRRIEQTCVFELSWGKGQELTTELRYPETLTTFYQAWQQAYLNFYKSALRARVDHSGALVSPPIDWRTQLVQAEAKLLSEFHYWLSSAELLEIRAEIAKAASGKIDSDTTPVDVFLTCEPLELARFPWEAWEIGTEFATTRAIRIARTPATIRAEAVRRKRRGRVRILAILGDDTGLNFQADREAVKALAQSAEVEFVGWQPGQDVAELKTRICRAIAAEQGWDVLFFAGHSNETALTGGELVIAPNESILVQEIAPQLTLARERGLQFAIFNSCNGLTIANTLINLGLSQVAVMREPIHNRVAQEFLVRFLQHLAEFKDVHDAMLAACQSLKLERNLTYPSVYLIPSLFRHPDSALFRMEPVGWQQQLRRWLPLRHEAIALSTLLLLSLLPIQSFFLEPRLWVQALYRDITRQIPKTEPPVVLVQIDKDSLQRGSIRANKINPMDRSYLAHLLNRVLKLNPKVVGVDYLLDQPTDDDQQLAKSVQRAVQQNTWLVFAAVERETGGEIGVTPQVASLESVQQGYIDYFKGYVELIPASEDCSIGCPFAYVLSLASALNQAFPDSRTLPAPAQSKRDFRTQVLAYAQQNQKQDSRIEFLWKRRHLSPVTGRTNWTGLAHWLRPIIDFSIPPDRVYRPIPAWQVLSPSSPDSDIAKSFSSSAIAQPIILLAPGGYDQAGTITPGDDNYATPPMAFSYWNQQPQIFTGGQSHAYAIHNLLNQRLVVPIPDLWMIGVAALLGKGLSLLIIGRKRWWIVAGIVATVAYGLLSLQMYISVAFLLPWLLPSVAFWIYTLPASGRKSHD